MGERDQLVRLLQSGRSELRRFALERLMKLGELPSATMLRELCQDEDGELRALAARCLQTISSHEVVSQSDTPPAMSPRPSFRIPQLKKAALQQLKPCTDALVALAHQAPAIGEARRAIATLGHIRDWDTVDALIDLLGRSEVEDEVAVALAAIADLRAVGPVIGAVRASVHRRPTVVLALAGFKTRDAMLELITYLHEDAEDIRAQAALTLREHAKADEVREALLEALGDPARAVVVNALLALKAVADDSLAAELIDFYDSGRDEHVRATVLSALQGTSDMVEDVLELIRQAVGDPDSRVRANAVECLCTLDVETEYRRQLLDGLLDDTDNRVRANVARAYGSVDITRSLDLLQSMVASRDKWVRASAVFAARDLLYPEVSNWLLSVLASEVDEDVIRNAVSSLQCHGTSDITASVLDLAAHTEPLVRSAAVRVLASRQEAQVSASLGKLYSTEVDAAVRAEIVAALGTLGAADCSSLLCEALKEHDDRIQRAAIEALDRLGRFESIPVIVPFLHGADHKLRATAALALWHQGCLMVVDGLTSMLAHPAERFRESAMNALSAIGDELPLLGRTAETMHLCAALAESSQVGSRSALPDLPPEDLGPVDEVESQASDGFLDGLFLLADGQVAAAIEKVRSPGAAGSTATNDGTRAHLTALCLQRDGRDEEALAAFQKATTTEESFFPGAVECARLEQGRGDSRAAYAAYLAAFRMKTRFVDGLLDQAARLLEEGRLVELSTVVRELMTVEALDKGAYRRMGLLCLKVGRYDMARQLLRHACIMQPGDSRILFNLALACYQGKYYDECRTLCTRVLSIVSDDAPERQRSQHLLSLLT